MKNIDFITGSILKKLIAFAVPLFVGNLLQQFYNVADTLIVGRFIGAEALAAVGSAYSLMTFITSILLGLCLGCSTIFSIRIGDGDKTRLKKNLLSAFVFISSLAILLNIVVFVFNDSILKLLNVPSNVFPIIKEYLFVIYFGFLATFLYNFYAFSLRAFGSSFVPLLFLCISSLLNIVLDLYFIIVLSLGVQGAALATVISQWFSALGLIGYSLIKEKRLRFDFKLKLCASDFKEIIEPSLITCMQQSVMNMGILLVQGIVNSFGSVVMAAFASSVKIDTIAYMPLQDFGNAFSTFVAQNEGARKGERIKKGFKTVFVLALAFGLIISLVVFVFAPQLMSIFIEDIEIINIGTIYLRIEGAFYFLIGWLFLFYGFFRAVNRPTVSLVLTIISLGLRVILAYLLSKVFGVIGIWVSIPIGWLLADVAGFFFLKFCKIFSNRS